MILMTVLIFIGLLLALVLVHEWGHFIAAKKAGCRVEEFGFGFPPRLFSYTYHDTRYSFNLLPIGGFVKIEGEDMQDSNPAPTSFGSKSALWRIIILSAGVIMNVVLATILLTWQGMIGFPTLITEENKQTLTDHHTYILEVAPNSPAAQAGVQALDRIAELEQITDPTIEDVQTLLQQKAGESVAIVVDRQGTKHTLQVTPRLNPPAGEGALGISLAATGLEKIPWWEAPWFGIKRTGTMLAAIVTQFWLLLQRLLAEGNVGGNLTGPIGIAVYTNEAAKLGLSYILEFGALISLNLALINILPLPALDGGRIIFVLLEKIRGHRLPVKFEQITHTIGFALLIFLMLLITFRDIRRFF
ncbi:MAG: RIP metalloprotease RseP [Candidatus Andersenbacteria bacterium]